MPGKHPGREDAWPLDLAPVKNEQFPLEIFGTHTEEQRYFLEEWTHLTRVMGYTDVQAAKRLNVDNRRWQRFRAKAKKWREEQEAQKAQIVAKGLKEPSSA